MKILLIAPTTEPVSGWGTYAQNTQNGLKEAENEVFMLTTSEGLPCPLSLMSSPFSIWKAAQLIKKAVSNHHPDVIHILAEPYAIAMPIAAIKTPWVMNFHGTYSVTPHTNFLTRGLMRKALRSAAGFLVCSNYTLKQVKNVLSKEMYDNVTQKTHPILLAIEPTSSKSSLQKEVLFVGEIKARKGVLELVQGFAHYVKTHSSTAVLHLAGNYKEDGGYIEQIRKHIALTGITNQVKIHGRVDDTALQNLFNDAGAFVMLSKQDEYNFEGYGLVFLEANARGIPTISSKESGGAEAVIDGETGFVVEHGNVQQIAERLHWILDEKQIDSAACKAWANDHNIEQQVQTCEKLYKSVTTS
ncbi:MAG: glycosyltransferase family 4 protein [bacterium]|nr:glycosyltransferase family 4 protein [bacterium]MDA1292359.1 glycosyltransferase family 4 protein [bacterium]